MNCEYVEKYYGVPACVGRRVIVHGRPGIIAEDQGHYIGVNFDSDKPDIIYPVHPTDDVKYLEIGKIRKMTRSQRRYLDYRKASDCFDSFAEYLKWEGSHGRN